LEHIVDVASKYLLNGKLAGRWRNGWVGGWREGGREGGIDGWASQCGLRGRILRKN
jgi:hypothetical protein